MAAKPRSREVVVRINRMKGRPDGQIGSVSTTPLRIAALFDWARLPPGITQHAVLSLMDALFDKQGAPKLVPRCTYPLTGLGCIDRVYTDLGTFAVGAGGVRVLELHGVTAGELAGRLAPLRVEG